MKKFALVFCLLAACGKPARDVPRQVGGMAQTARQRGADAFLHVAREDADDVLAELDLRGCQGVTG